MKTNQFIQRVATKTVVCAGKWRNGHNKEAILMNDSPKRSSKPTNNDDRISKKFTNYWKRVSVLIVPQCVFSLIHKPTLNRWHIKNLLLTRNSRRDRRAYGRLNSWQQRSANNHVLNCSRQQFPSRLARWAWATSQSDWRFGRRLACFLSHEFYCLAFGQDDTFARTILRWRTYAA